MNYIRNYTKKKEHTRKQKYIILFRVYRQTAVANITELQYIGMLDKLYTLRELTKHNLEFISGKISLLMYNNSILFWR